MLTSFATHATFEANTNFVYRTHINILFLKVFRKISCVHAARNNVATFCHRRATSKDTVLPRHLSSFCQGLTDTKKSSEKLTRFSFSLAFRARSKVSTYKVKQNGRVTVAWLRPAQNSQWRDVGPSLSVSSLRLESVPLPASLGFAVFSSRLIKFRLMTVKCTNSKITHLKKLH